MAQLTVVLEWQYWTLTRKCATVFHVDTGTGGAFTPAENIADAVDATGSLKAMINTNVSLTGVHVYNEEYEDTWAGSIAGLLSGALAPPNCTYLVHKIGGLRRFKGRMFLPGLREGDVNEGGVLSSTVVTTANAALTEFLTQVNTAAGAMTQKPSVANPSPAAVTSLVCDDLISTQRRRLR